jgi:hypothetical protein
MNQSELDGLYTSTVQSVQTYFDFFEQLHRVAEVGIETKQLVVLAMLLDFMAFVAQKLRTHCGSEWTQDELPQGRIALQIEINTIDARDPDPRPKEVWARTLCGIVANSGPLTTVGSAISTPGSAHTPYLQRHLSTGTCRTHRSQTPVPPSQETYLSASSSCLGR